MRAVEEFERNLEERLAGALGRLKLLYILNGLGHLLLRLLIAAVILFSLDYFLDLPRTVRVVLGLLSLGWLLFSAYRLLLYPLTRPVTSKDLALAVERRFPSLDGRLISALEMARLPEEKLMNRSPALLRASLEASRPAVEAASFKRLFAVGKVRGVLLAAAGLLALAAGYCAWQPAAAGIGLARMAGSSREWPRRTTLLVSVEDSGAADFKLLTPADPRGEQSVILARGASLPLSIAVEGHDPGAVEIEVLALGEGAGEGGGGGRGRFVVPARRLAKGGYRARIRDIRAPVLCRARGGDDDGRGREVRVSVVSLPDVKAVRVVYHYPPYLGLPDETSDSAEIEAPAGTRVDLALTLTSRAAKAALIVEEAGKVERRGLAVPESGPFVIGRSFDITASGAWRVELRDGNGFKNLDAPVHSIICRKDENPRIKIFFPRRKKIEVVPGAVVPLAALAEDDHGLARIGIRFRVAGSGKEETIDFIGAELDAPFGSKRIACRHVVDLAARRFSFAEGRRRLAPRDSLLYALFARDGRPGEEGGRAETPKFVVDVVSPGEKIRLLTERQIRLRREVKTLLASQKENRSKAASLLADADGEEGAAPAGTRAFLSLEMEQNRLGSRYGGAAREFAALCDEYLYNRIDRTSGAAALLERLLEARRNAPLAGAFEPALYRPLVADMRAGAFGEMDVMTRLLGMLEVSLEISMDLAPAAERELAAAAIAAGKSERRGRLGKALGLEEKIVGRLDLLLGRMAEWEDYQELLQMMHDVVDDQDRLNRRTREWIRK